MSATGLTPKLSECKTFIATYISMHGIAPTRREIADNLGLSSKGHANDLVDALVERGHARKVTRRRRAIVLIHEICPTCGRGRR